MHFGRKFVLENIYFCLLITGLKFFSNNFFEFNQMKNILLLLFLFFLIFTISCHKDSAPKPSQPAKIKIDVSKQWTSDFNGNLLISYPDSQWQNRSFNSNELALFNSFDTADLSGTTAPASVIVSPNYPNPLTAVTDFNFKFSNGYSGASKVEYVIVDSFLQPLKKGIFLVKGNATQNNPVSSFAIEISVDLPAGEYRFYYLLNALSDLRFFKAWGNIQVQ